MESRAEAVGTALVLHVVALLGIAVADGVAASLAGGEDGAAQFLVRVTLGNFAVLVAATYVYAAKLDVLDRVFSFRFDPVRDAAAIAVGVVAGIGIDVGVDAVLGVLELDVHRLEPFAGVPAGVLILLWFVAVAPGEEVLYRGGIQRTFTRVFPAWGAILATGVLFALFHLPSVRGDPAGVAIVMVGFVGFAVVYGVLYEATDNLAVPVLAHALLNTAGTLGVA